MQAAKNNVINSTEITLRMLLKDEVASPELEKAYRDVINHLHTTVKPKFDRE